MRITDSYKSTWCFRKIFFLALEVEFYLSIDVFLCKNIRSFYLFLDFECY